jgi:epsilon-lactone hydrolase
MTDEETENELFHAKMAAPVPPHTVATSPPTGAAPHHKPYAYVPTTISKEWREMLRLMPDPHEAPPLPAPDNLRAWRKTHDAAETLYQAENEAALRLFGPTLTPGDLGGVEVLEVKPKGWRDNGKLAVYTHGGAYTLFSHTSTAGSAALFADRTGLRVISVNYTTAPFAKWQQVTGEVTAVFKALQVQGIQMNNIAFYGDSAGGSLAAGVTLKMRDEGLGMPAALVLWSPWADITETGDTYATLAHADPSLLYAPSLKNSADAYADPAEQKYPYVSPVYGDFSQGFAPTLIQVGTKEIFLSNAIRLYHAIEAAGGMAKLDVYEGMPHVFQQRLPAAPESMLALQKVKQFLNLYVGGS